MALFPHRLWCTNQTEYFDLEKDPYELDNQAGVKGEHEEGEFSEMKRLLVCAITVEFFVSSSQHPQTDHLAYLFSSR